MIEVINQIKFMICICGYRTNTESSETIHILRKHIFSIFGSPSPLRKHVFSTENKQKIAFSDTLPATYVQVLT